jgi:hypothetical protein
MRITGRIGAGVVALSAMALAAGSAQAAPQFTPTATALVHTLASGEAGVAWSTGGLGVNGQVVYTAATTSLAMGGEINTMNYYDSLNGSCPTDAGSNCAVPYGTPLDFTVLADWINADVTPTGGGWYDIVLNFQSTGGTDISWTDPLDGNSIMLEASWVSGTFLGNPTPGLQVVSSYCDGIGGCGAAGLQGADPLVVGFALIDSGSLYASMWDSDSNPFTQDSILLDLSEFFDFSPTMDAIAAYVVANGTLPDFTGEGQGQIFRLETGDFVIPEPGTALLFGLGLAGVGMARRRIDR